MRERKIRIALSPRQCAAICVLFSCALGATAQAAQPGSSLNPEAENKGSITLDRVIAVVNRQVVLQSDLEDKMQLSVLDPSTNRNANDTKQKALDRLISRTLIQQQIQQENIPAAEPTPAEI